MPYAKLREDGRIVDQSPEEFEGGVEFRGELRAMGDGLLDYAVQGGEAVYDQAPEHEVAELKERLRATDYVAAKIAEGAATREEYADVIARRQAWRDRINELGS